MRYVRKIHCLSGASLNFSDMLLANFRNLSVTRPRSRTAKERFLCCYLYVAIFSYNYYSILGGNPFTFSRDLSISLLLEKYVSGYLKLYKTSAAIQICFTFLILHEKSPTLKETHGQSFRLSMCLIIYCNTECSSCHYLNSTTLLLECADYSSWRMSIF